MFSCNPWPSWSSHRNLVQASEAYHIPGEPPRSVHPSVRRRRRQIARRRRRISRHILAQLLTQLLPTILRRAGTEQPMDRLGVIVVFGEHLKKPFPGPWV